MQARENTRILIEHNNKERVQEGISERRSCQHDVDETGHFPTQQAIKAIIEKAENDSYVMKINKKCAAASQYGCYRWVQVGEAFRSKRTKELRRNVLGMGRSMPWGLLAPRGAFGCTTRRGSDGLPRVNGRQL